MEKYTYEPLNLGRPAIRLLYLHRGGTSSEISCSLFQAELHQRDNAISYEALSYTWGSPDMTETIIVDGYHLNVTSHLYIALQHLRYKDEDRILWIDAICIDQGNKKERGHQVEQMGKIYKEADRVIFWLGSGTFETDALIQSLQLLQRESTKHTCADWSLQDDRWTYLWACIEPSFKKSFTHFRNLQQRGLQELLARPWFRRVWILQEVAFARAGSIFCGTKSVPTRLFGLLPRLLEIKPDIHCQSVLDIMPSPWRKSSWWSKSPNLRTLLLNFGNSEATETRDLVYALRGMSSDAGEKNGILPDYEKSEEGLLREVVLFIEHCELEDLAFRTPPRTIRDLIKCLRDLDLHQCMALAKKGLPRDIELLLKRPEIKINQEIITAAAACDKNGEVVEILLRHREKEFTISNEVLVATAKNPCGAKQIFEVFFGYQGGKFTISDEVLIAAAENVGCGDKVLELLLSYNWDQPKIDIRDEILIAAAKNEACGDKAIHILLSYRQDPAYIPNKAIVAAAENGGCGDRLADLILYRGTQEDISTIISSKTRSILKEKEIVKSQFDFSLLQALLSESKQRKMFTYVTTTSETNQEDDANRVFNRIFNENPSEITITEHIIQNTTLASEKVSLVPNDQFAVLIGSINLGIPIFSPARFSIELFLQHHGEAILPDELLDSSPHNWETLRRLTLTKKFLKLHGSKLARDMAKMYGIAVAEDLTKLRQKRKQAFHRQQTLSADRHSHIPQVIDKLNSKKLQVNWILFKLAIWKSDLEMISFFLSRGMYSEERYEPPDDDQTMLEISTEAENGLANRFDIEARDIYGQSLLAMAVEARRYAAVELLLQYGADVRSKDIYGRTPLTLASGHERTNIFDLLLEYEAKGRYSDLY